MSSWLPRCGSRVLRRPDEADAVVITRQSTYVMHVMIFCPHPASALPRDDPPHNSSSFVSVVFVGIVVRGRSTRSRSRVESNTTLPRSNNDERRTTHDVDDDGNNVDSARSSGLHRRQLLGPDGVELHRQRVQPALARLERGAAAAAGAGDGDGICVARAALDIGGQDCDALLRHHKDPLSPRLHAFKLGERVPTRRHLAAAPTQIRCRDSRRQPPPPRPPTPPQSGPGQKLHTRFGAGVRSPCQRRSTRRPSAARRPGGPRTTTWRCKRLRLRPLPSSDRGARGPCNMRCAARLLGSS